MGEERKGSLAGELGVYGCELGEGKCEVREVHVGLGMGSVSIWKRGWGDRGCCEWGVHLYSDAGGCYEWYES